MDSKPVYSNIGKNVKEDQLLDSAIEEEVATVITFLEVLDERKYLITRKDSAGAS